MEWGFEFATHVIRIVDGSFPSMLRCSPQNIVSIAYGDIYEINLNSNILFRWVFRHPFFGKPNLVSLSNTEPHENPLILTVDLAMLRTECKFAQNVRNERILF